MLFNYNNKRPLFCMSENKKINNYADFDFHRKLMIECVLIIFQKYGTFSLL